MGRYVMSFPEGLSGISAEGYPVFGEEERKVGVPTEAGEVFSYRAEVGGAAALMSRRSYGSTERIASASMPQAFERLLMLSAVLGEKLDMSHRFWQTRVMSHPGESRIVATYYLDQTKEDIDALASDVQRLIEHISQFSRVQFTTPDNVSPLTEGSTSERIEFTVNNIPTSPDRRSRRQAPPGSPGMGVPLATTAEIGSANSTPT